MKYIVDEKFRAKYGHIKYLDKLRDLALQNRHQPTLAEKAFWHKIKDIKPQFLRQKPIGRFILDFYCSKLLLDVEIDGDYHQERKYYDQGREELLHAMGIKTVRFSNKQVLNSIGNVINELRKIIKVRTMELGVADFFSKD
ncbi:MAG TPA: endonuclease domain-containing protein [Candidatus Woesebacteria bacterium]|nr:endonuclease domain-containing protein [Candidatus Woesebacteria bacterium]HPJ16731.1 endonuclease domain-containing protein [Candidatus Woesebacteria bacterium]